VDFAKLFAFRIISFHPSARVLKGDFLGHRPPPGRTPSPETLWPRTTYVGVTF